MHSRALSFQAKLNIFSNSMRNQRDFIVIALLLIILPSCIIAYPGNNYRDLDICNHWNGRRHFLELGERGDLHARNVTTSAFRSSLFSSSSIPANIGYNTNNTNTTADIWYQCNLELVTCAECVIRITFTHSNFSKICDRTSSATNSNGVNKQSLTMCPCEHIQFSEPPYDTALSGQEFCGNGKVFRSKTRTLLLKFFYRATNSHVFSLQYFSERNVKIISGSPKQSIVSNYSKNQPEVISTPYFPMAYPRDYGIEHILTCESDDCQVRLDFTDFQLGLSSTLEIFDSNGQRLDSYTGEHFRPPITVSNGKSLLLQFRGNGASGVGFRAEVTFISSKQIREERLVPYTDCGGIVSGPGGAITMMNMIENATDVRYYDCIWIIKPGNNYMMMKTHISLRVEEFLGMASRSDLIIRQGTTSDSGEIEKIVWPNNGLSKENHIAPILTGYYIRLRGVFGISSKLAIVYSVFNYMNCYIGSEFLCNNNHCISIRLHCDSFDHCGDGTDEPESCEEDWAHLHNDRRWYSHKANYYFPKIEQYPDLKTATGIFIVSTLGIFAVLSGWMVILYRMGVRARQQRELQSHLQTISELLDRQEEMQPDDPPSYEAPPEYEEVIKVGMEQELRETRQREARARNRQHNQNQNRHRDGRSCGHALNNPAIHSGGVVVPVHGQMSATPTNTSDACENPCTRDHCDGPSTSAGMESINVVNVNDRQTEAEKIANRVLMAAALCGASETSRSKGESNCCNFKSVGVSTSPTSVSSGCQLSSTSTGTEARYFAANCSYGTPSQFEECSRQFGDESLNISFSLAIPPTSNTSTIVNGGTVIASIGGGGAGGGGGGGACFMDSARARSFMDCNEQTYLKHSCPNEANQDIHNYKVRRLRHTFSSPDGFTTVCNELQLPDVRTYGTHLPHDRSCNLSAATNFGSDLSRDTSKNSSIWCSGGSEHDHQRNAAKQIQHCALLHFPLFGIGTDGHFSACQSNATVATDSNATLLGLSMDDDDVNTSMDDDQRKRLIAAETVEPDSDCERRQREKSISCFGSVNKACTFRVVSSRRHRHVRSKSLTSNSDHRASATPPSTHEHRKAAMKRSSSADLVERLTPSIAIARMGATSVYGATAASSRDFMHSASGRRERRPVYI